MYKDAVKVVVVDQDQNVLVLRRSDSHPLYPLHPDFPGGDVEDGESIEAALLRELSEETGICADSRCLEHLDTWDNQYGTQHHLYLLETGVETPEVMVSWEHDRHEWKPLAILLQEESETMTDSFYKRIVHYMQNRQGTLRSL
jgi:8-oxo-dGTP diphosphatase